MHADALRVLYDDLEPHVCHCLESLTSTILSRQLAGRDSPLRPEVAGNLLHYGR